MANVVVATTQNCDVIIYGLLWELQPSLPSSRVEINQVLVATTNASSLWKFNFWLQQFLSNHCTQLFVFVLLDASLGIDAHNQMMAKSSSMEFDYA